METAGGKFDFAGFGYDGGSDELFVAHAGRYTPEEFIELCKKEYAYRFCENRKTQLREPQRSDVQDLFCAFRLGASPAWPDGCYTFVGKGERGSFPVWVIDFADLVIKKDGDDENGTEKSN